MAAAVAMPAPAPHGPAAPGARQVPPLDTQAVRANQKPVVTNDEVAAILRGLRLDKPFFLGKLCGELLEELRPPPLPDRCEGGDVDPRMQRRRSSIEALSVEGLNRRMEKERLKAQQSRTAAGRARAASIVMVEGEHKKADFDLYLNQALLPVLAQALDSLCRQLNRMEEQGGALDPLVRARFNPLTWLAQQLLRRHPSCARTPRRQAVYRSFREWSDQERGRREMLRIKDIVHHVFNGFVLRGTVQRATIPKVVNAIDDTLKLGGALKGNPHVQRAMGPVGQQGPVRHAGHAKSKSQFFQGDAWSFSHFWFQLATLIVSHDVVPYSAIERGAKLQAQELQDRIAREDAQRAMEEARKQRQADQRRQEEEYARLREEFVADPQIVAILEQNKMLTGDDMRPGDLGYEFEVPPKGAHVSLVSDLLELLGFELAHRRPWRSELSDEQAEQEWWTNDKADSWSVLQAIHGVALADGVVEREVLKKVLVPPEGFLLLKSRVEDEFERRAEAGEGDYERGGDVPSLNCGSTGSKQKPTMEALCERHGMTMARMTWLHELFESYLLPEEDAPKEAPPPTCGYPENPASILKPQMRALVSEVNPNLTEAEFDARFRRIDEDGSGEIEFDEFVAWVHNDEIQVVGSSSRKMAVAELSQAYAEPLALINYLHTCFKDQLPEGQVDGYPGEPAALSKADVRELLEVVTLQRVDDDEFEAEWQIVDANDRGCLDFDEFLEILDFDELPADVREQYQ